MDPLDPQFDDPALRAALSRALGNERAPASLRNRVVAALDHEDHVWMRWRKPLVALATAAVLLIGFGVAYMTLWRSGDRPIPQFIAAAMVSVHDQYANAAVQPNIKDTDLNTIRQKLRDQVGHPVLVAMLGDGWTFQGADVTTLSKIPAAHLLFTRGDEAISIFSLDARALYSNAVADGTGYSQTENGHPISGFVWSGAVHCLVGSSKSGDLTMSELTRLRDQLRPSGNNSQISMALPPALLAQLCQ